jgi:hypothetical protein
MNDNHISTCKALVPMDTMDTQAMALIGTMKKSKAQTPAEKHKRRMASIRACTTDSTMEGAVCILDAMGYRNDIFHHKSSKWEVWDLINEEYFPEHAGRFAAETCVFWFWGGPPDKLKWYEGTLQTMLDDRVMCEVIEHGAEAVAKLIGIDLEASDYEFTHNQKRRFKVRA